MASDLYAHLASSPLLPFYALVGPEAVLVTEAVAALRARVLPEGGDLDRDELSAKETPVARVVEAAATSPMLSPRRFVHLRGIEELSAKEHPPLLAYLERPSPRAVLCLSGAKIDQRTKLGQKLAAAKALFVLEPPRQHEVASWLMRRAARIGVKLEREAAELVAEIVGVEVGSLDRALEKAALYASPRDVITADDIEATVAPTRVYNIFALTGAMGDRDLARASALLANILGGGESALGVLGMLTRQLRHLLRSKALEAVRMSPRDFAATLGVPAFLVTELKAQARRYTEAELVAALEAALRADISLKSSRLGAEVVLGRMLLDVMTPTSEVAHAR